MRTSNLLLHWRVDTMTRTQALETFFGGSDRQRLERFVASRFPRLRNSSDDLIQDVLLEVLQSTETPQDPTSTEQWFAFLCRRLRWRAIDRLRELERQALSSLASGSSGDSSSSQRSSGANPTATGPAPPLAAMEAERRHRQVLLLSDVLREFTRWCESRSNGFRMKELYERRLRDQSPSAIMEAMGMTRAAFDQTLKRARDWILNRVKQHDVHHSVFQTILVGRQQEPVEVHIPLGNIEARFASFNDVLRFVVEEMGALCPDPQRVEAYVETPNALELSDVRYHIEEADCRLCDTSVD